MSFPDATLVICTRNRPKLLSDTVASIRAGTRLPSEIVIVDQSDSPHPTFAARASYAAVPPIRYVHDRSSGLSRARNRALREARHSLIVSTDDDVIVAADWLENLVRAWLRARRDTVVTGRVLPADPDGSGGFVPTLKSWIEPVVVDGPARFDPLVTFNMAGDRRVFEAVGGFDERLGPGTRFPAGEDNEFAHRVLAAGFRIACVPAATVFHRAWRGAGEYVPLRWDYGRGQGAFFAKHLRPGDVHMWRRLVGTFIGVAAGAPRRLIARSTRPGRRLSRRRLAAGDLAYAIGTLAGAADWLRTHRLAGRETRAA